MIKVTSTEFQNRVGYYLELLAEGKQLLITKSKPVRREIVLNAKNILKSKQQTNKDRILEIVESNKDFKPKYYTDALELQNAVRS